MTTAPAPATPVRRKLPIGLQTLAKLRGEGCYYVDKTRLVIDLIESGTYYFLSRPRRFGKSLLLDTFKELFEGNRAGWWSCCRPATWPGRALQQIRDRGYADRYRARGEPIHLVGVEFSRDSRNIVGFGFERLPSARTPLT